MAARIRVVHCIPPGDTSPSEKSVYPHPHVFVRILRPLSFSPPVSSRRCWRSSLDCNPIEFLSSRAERGSNLLEVKARRGLRSRSSCQAVLCHAASCFCIPDFLCAVWHCIFHRLLVCVFCACMRVSESASLLIVVRDTVNSRLAFFFLSSSFPCMTRAVGMTVLYGE